MEINEAAERIEAFVTTYAGASGRRAKEIRVHPSGDEADVIKVWVDLGGGVSDEVCDAWARQLERDGAAEAGGFRLEVRAESL